jgi:hypothetical protein
VQQWTTYSFNLLSIEDSFKISKLCSLANLANFANLASKKCPNPRKCLDSPDSPTFAKQFGKDLPDSPTLAKQFGRTRQTHPHLPKAISGKNVTRLDTFARVIRHSHEFGASGHCLTYTQNLKLKLFIFHCEAGNSLFG